MLADEADFVIGGDTHRDQHALAVVRAITGGVEAARSIPADRRGYRLALRFAEQHAPRRRVWALEATGGYGAGLARFLADHGERVLELDRPARNDGPTRAKSDELDAIRAARTLLGRDKHSEPRAGGVREALRALVTTRAGAMAARTAAINQLKALIVSAPEPLREQLPGLPRERLVNRCLSLRTHPSQPPERRATALALRACARRVRALSEEAEQLKREVALQVQEYAPHLLAEPGVGPISAAQVLLAWSHRGRFARESRFARLAGVAPIPASSGLRPRYRLDRGGDRQLNRALHTIVLGRRQHHQATIAYLERRQAEGKTSREAVRCLKRYLARRLFRLLEHPAATTDTGPAGSPPAIGCGPLAIPPADPETSPS
jgi:transposase